MHLSEEYYTSKIKDIIKDINSSNDELLEDILEQVMISDSNMSDRLYEYKKFLLYYTEGFKDIFKKISGTSKDISTASKNARNISDDITKGIDKLKSNIPLAKKLAIGIPAAILGIFIVKKAFDYYNTKLYGPCKNLKGEDRIVCRIKSLDDYKAILIDQLKNCDESDNPDLCKFKILKAIQKLELQKKKIMRKL